MSGNGDVSLQCITIFGEALPFFGRGLCQTCYVSYLLAWTMPFLNVESSQFIKSWHANSVSSSNLEGSVFFFRFYAVLGHILNIQDFEKSKGGE